MWESDLTGLTGLVQHRSAGAAGHLWGQRARGGGAALLHLERGERCVSSERGVCVCVCAKGSLQEQSACQSGVRFWDGGSIKVAHEDCGT